MTRNFGNLLLIASFASGLWAADAQRGAMVLDDAGCLECHTVNGQGIGHEANATAPELGASLAPAYTAPALASAVWNHTPAMLADMLARRVDRPAITANDWEDLFAYLYSVQFLEFPAERGRGKEAFESKLCAGCHSRTTGSNAGIGKAVADWKPLDDPVTLIYRMWSHASTMDSAARDVKWSKPGWTKIDGRDLMDLTVYIQQLQGQFPESHFSLPDPAAGKPVFDQNCGGCHSGPLALESLLSNTTWMDIGAGMWDHVPMMRRVPSLTEAEMRKVLAYVWELQYRGAEGNKTRGQQTFSEKGCLSCHRDHGIGKVTPASIAAIGWGAGRKMHERMENAGVAWPHLTAEDVSDLAAYMTSLPGK